MKGINVGRVIAGGLLAGLVITIGEAILNMPVLGAEWDQAMSALGITQGTGAIVFYTVAAFVIGIVGVWMYAAMRPRLGPGPATAIKVGLVIWLLGWAWPTLGLLFWDVFPTKLIWVALVWSVVEVPVAMMAGAWLYREDAAA